MYISRDSLRAVESTDMFHTGHLFLKPSEFEPFLHSLPCGGRYCLSYQNNAQVTRLTSVPPPINTICRSFVKSLGSVFELMHPSSQILMEQELQEPLRLLTMSLAGRSLFACLSTLLNTPRLVLKCQHDAECCDNAGVGFNSIQPNELQAGASDSHSFSSQLCMASTYEDQVRGQTDLTGLPSSAASS